MIKRQEVQEPHSTVSSWAASLALV